MFAMTYWHWFTLGLILIIVEVAAPGLVSLFFGLSALLVGLLCLAIPMPQWLQWVLFAVLSVALLLGLRKWLKSFFGGRSSQSHAVENDIVGQRAVVTQAIGPNRPGKVELRGANWEAAAGETLEPGTPVRVVKKESISLTVERI